MQDLVIPKNNRQIVWLSLVISNRYNYRPQRSWGKVMFLHMSVILFIGGGGIPAWIAGGIPACLAAALGQGGRWYPSMPCRFPGPHPRGKFRGLAGGVSRSTSKGEVQGSGWGGLQVHTWGRVSRPTPGGSPGPHPGGLQAHTQGGCIPACTEADPPNGYCCGRYASYWNAFLYRSIINLIRYATLVTGRS